MIDGTELEMCDSYKYLGVNFDKNLDWKFHIKYVCQKVSKACGSIAKIRNCVDINTLREVYHALVHSYIRYGIIVWGTASQTSLKPLQTVINRALRIMCFAPLGRFDANPLYEILDILKLEDIYSLEVGKCMYKVQRNLLPVTIANYFSVQQPSQHRYIILEVGTLPNLQLLTIELLLGKDQFKKRETIFGIGYLPILRNV